MKRNMMQTLGAMFIFALLSISVLAQAEAKKAADDNRAPIVKETESSWKRAKKWTLDYVDAMPENALNCGWRRISLPSKVPMRILINTDFLWANTGSSDGSFLCLPQPRCGGLFARCAGQYSRSSEYARGGAVVALVGCSQAGNNFCLETFI